MKKIIFLLAAICLLGLNSCKESKAVDVTKYEKSANGYLQCLTALNEVVKNQKVTFKEYEQITKDMENHFGEVALENADDEMQMKLLSVAFELIGNVGNLEGAPAEYKQYMEPEEDDELYEEMMDEGGYEELVPEDDEDLMESDSLAIDDAA